MNKLPKRIVITPGEPAGIGPDLLCQIAQTPSYHERVVIADSDLLIKRAKRLKLPLEIAAVDWSCPPRSQSASQISIESIPCQQTTVPGKLNQNNALYVIETLRRATKHCLQKQAVALITGPVHKGIINAANIPFTGHTEFLQQHTQASQVVMLMSAPQLKVALTTTHLPLREVPQAITSDRLSSVIQTLDQGLRQQFAITQPKIGVCGINPHAGEQGHLGTEEQCIILPCIQQLQAEGLHVSGPFPADTIFITEQCKTFDVILAMYHDQGLPVIKHMAFDQTVNVTLGLPFIRTSVDHGTALDLAATADSILNANPSSFQAAISLASQLALNVSI